MDQKKDRRLVYLLLQTDEYLKNLTGLVQQHQLAERHRRKEERRMEKQRLKEEKLQQEERMKAAMANGATAPPPPAPSAARVVPAPAAVSAGTSGAADDSTIDLDESSQSSDIPVKVREVSTGKILSDADAPKSSQLESWLEMNPGFEVVSRDEHGGDGEEISSEESDDDLEEHMIEVKEMPPIVEMKSVAESLDLPPGDEMDEDARNRAYIQKAAAAELDEDDKQEKDHDEEKSYILTVHRVEEKVTEQPQMMIGGQLKEYQVCQKV